MKQNTSVKFGHSIIYCLFVCLFVCLIVILIIFYLGLPFGEDYPVVVVTCAALFNAFSIVGWNALDCLSVEAFPLEVC